MLSWVSLISGRYTLFGSASLMSLVSILGLVMGVAVLILVLSVINGFERELRQRVLSVLPHGVIETGSPIQNYKELMIDLKQHELVVDAAPYVNGSALLVANSKMEGTSYSGILPELEQNVSVIGTFLQEVSLDILKAGEYKLLMGKTLADNLKLSVGDKVSLVLPEVQFTLAGALPRLKVFRLAGLFEVESDIDKEMVFIHIEDAKVLKRMKGIMGIRLLMTDMFEAPEVIHDLTTRLRDRSEYRGLRGRSWFATHGNLYNAILMQKSTMFLLLFLLIAVAAFNVISNLIMTVNEKQVDIAILKTLGATSTAILLVFMLHGAMVGFLGVLIGLVLGLAAAYWASDFSTLLESELDLGLMDEYFIHYLPSEILLSDVVIVALVSFLICVCASIYPALKAASSRPVETLQYET